MGRIAHVRRTFLQPGHNPPKMAAAAQDDPGRPINTIEVCPLRDYA